MLKYTIPEVVLVSEPFNMQYFITLKAASFLNRIVDVPAVAAVLVLSIIMFFATRAFTLPSIVTLSAPFRSIRGAARFPDMIIPGTVGVILTEIHAPAFKTAEAVSVV